jgi:hypothetical protein
MNAHNTEPPPFDLNLNSIKITYKKLFSSLI